LSAIGSIGVLLIGVAFLPVLAAHAEKSQPVKIAVFAFELEDVRRSVNADPAVRGSRKVADELLLSEGRGSDRGRLRPRATRPQCRDRHSSQ
jgi:hypothetical protein